MLELFRVGVDEDLGSPGVHRLDVVVQLSFGLAEGAQLSLVARIEFVPGQGLQVKAVLARGGTGAPAAGAEEGVVAHPAILQVGVVQGIHTRDPLRLRESEGGEGGRERDS
jgi:hypothetical protein